VKLGVFGCAYNLGKGIEGSAISGPDVMVIS
jgi:hypothetical protein